MLRFTAQADQQVGNGDFYRANFATGAAQGGGGGQGVRGSEEIANIRRMLAGSLTAVERVEAVINWADGGGNKYFRHFKRQIQRYSIINSYYIKLISMFKIPKCVTTSDCL